VEGNSAGTCGILIFHPPLTELPNKTSAMHTRAISSSNIYQVTISRDWEMYNEQEYDIWKNKADDWETEGMIFRQRQNPNKDPYRFQNWSFDAVHGFLSALLGFTLTAFTYMLDTILMMASMNTKKWRHRTLSNYFFIPFSHTGTACMNWTKKCCSCYQQVKVFPRGQEEKDVIQDILDSDEDKTPQITLLGLIPDTFLPKGGLVWTVILTFLFAGLAGGLWVVSFQGSNFLLRGMSQVNARREIMVNITGECNLGYYLEKACQGSKAYDDNGLTARALLDPSFEDSAATLTVIIAPSLVVAGAILFSVIIFLAFLLKLYQENTCGCMNSQFVEYDKCLDIGHALHYNPQKMLQRLARVNLGPVPASGAFSVSSAQVCSAMTSVIEEPLNK
jgi:hypothetical protein